MSTAELESFADLEGLIKDNISNGTYPLKNDDVDIPILFGMIPVFKDLVIDDVFIDSEPLVSITVNGSGVFLDFEDLDIELKFKYEGKDDYLREIITYSLHIILPPYDAKKNLLYAFAKNLMETIPLPNLIPLPQIEFSDFLISITPAKKKVDLKVKAKSDWEIPLGFSNLKLSEIELSLTSKEGKISSGTFGGKLEIGGVIVAIKCKIPGKFELKTTIPTFNLSSLLQFLCGPTAIQNSSSPLSFLELEIRNLSFAIVVDKGLFQFNVSGETDFGKAEFFIGQVSEKEKTTEPDQPSTTTKKWAFAVGFSPPETFKFSEINPSLSALDDLKLPNIDLILSSAELDSNNLPTIDIGRRVKIKRGINLFVTFDLTGTDIDKLIGLEKLGLTGQIGLKPFSLLLGASIDGTINIADILELRNVNFEIEIPPISLAIKTQMALQLGTDLLMLTLAAKFVLKDRTLNLAGTMEGAWNEPFGFKGVTIEDVALELGINFTTTPIPFPLIGFAGTLKVGDFYGSGAIKINPTDPTQCMLKINFNKLFLIDVIKLFCDPSSINKFPKGFLDVLNGIGFEKVNIYIVPTTVYIGELKYDPGFAIQGFMHFLDWNAIIDLRLDYEKGIKIYGKFDPIVIPGLFSLRGAGGTLNPLVDISLYEGESPHFYVSGSLEILGIRAETDISIDEYGFRFMIAGKIFNLLDATLLVEGGEICKSEDFRIRAVLHNDILNVIRNGLIDAIKFFADETSDALSALIKEVDKAQAVVGDFDRQIANVTEQIKREREIAANDLSKAQRILNRARRNLVENQKPVDEMRKIIQAERDSAKAALDKGIKDVQNAKIVLNDLDNQISYRKGRINKLNAEIARLDRQWWECGLDLVCKWRCSDAATRKRLEVTALYLQKGVVELQRAAAWVALEVAELALKGIRALIVVTPIELDPRMIGLIAARDIAAGALAVVEGVLFAAEAAVVHFPIELDPRIVALVTLKGTAQVALEAVELALKAFKAGVDTLRNVAINIINAGFDSIFNIRSIWFDAKLGAASGGIILLIMDVVFRQESHKIMFEFDFNDVVGSFARLGHQIISGQLKYAPEAKIIEIEDLSITPPVIQPPEVEAPEVEAPEVEAPEVEAPEVEAPEVIEALEVIEAPEFLEEPLETQIKVRAYYISLKNYSYNDLCWLVAEKILKYTVHTASTEDTKKKAQEVFSSSYKYEELCWLNAEMDLLLREAHLKKAPEKPPETQIRPVAYYFSLKNYSYNDLCWMLAEKILKYTVHTASIEDTKKKAQQVFRSSYTYDELCWLNVEMELLLSYYQFFLKKMA